MASAETQTRSSPFNNGASSPSTVTSSVLHGPKCLKLETRLLEAPAPAEAQVAICSTGLCGSDLHYYNDYKNGDILVREPLILGHEAAGIIVAIGSQVGSLRVGDRVALEVGLPCGTCQRCEEGRYNICESISFRSSAKQMPHFQGTLQDRINHPAKWCYKLPDSMPLTIGALLEPLSVAIHAARRAQLSTNSTVVVFGAGAIGLLCGAMAKSQGASNIIIADIDQGRVDFAVENGFAHRGFTAPRGRSTSVEEGLQTAKETAVAIQDAGKGGDNGCQIDVVFECTGTQACVQAGIFATRPGGRVMLVGMGTPVQTLPVSAAALREVDLIGVFRYANTYPRAIEIASQRGHDTPDLSKLITHRFEGLQNVPKAFEMAGKTRDADGSLVLKVVVETG